MSKFNFSQNDRYEQIKKFYPGLRVHTERFSGDNGPDDLDEYLKEFSVISGLFAIRLHADDENSMDLGFQLFIEDNGNFYLWDKIVDCGICWLNDLQKVITETMNLIMLDGRKRIIDNVFPAVAQLNGAISFKKEK